jgi:hypothetical protein
MMAPTKDCRIPCSANFRFTEFSEARYLQATPKSNTKTRH